MKRFIGLSAFAMVLGAMIGCAKPIAPAPPPMPNSPAISGLRSPWDLTPVPVTDRPFDCGSPAPIGPDITLGSINDPNRHLSNEIKDAAYAESTTALQDVTHRVVEAADNFRTTGSHAAAACVVSLLSDAANNRAMTGYVVNSRAMDYHNLALRAFAIAYLKVRQAHAGSPQQNQAVLEWMTELVREERSYWEDSHCGTNGCARQGHKGNETAVAAMAVGIAAEDHSLVNYAIGHYRAEVSMINDQGMLHYDMDRGHALTFNLKSAAALVQIAEFAEINNIPLYGYDNGRLHLLVHTVALGLVSPSAFQSATRTTQNISSSIEPWEVSWAAVYNRRFPDPIMTGLLNQAGPGGADMWGGQPWDEKNAS